MSGETILRISNLHVSIEETQILRGVDLEINSGEIDFKSGRVVDWVFGRVEDLFTFFICVFSC